MTRSYKTCCRKNASTYYGVVAMAALADEDLSFEIHCGELIPYFILLQEGLALHLPEHLEAAARESDNPLVQVGLTICDEL